jgi:predicted nucleotide-binding protein
LATSKYSRKTVLAASNVLKCLGHSGFDQMLLEFGLYDRNAGRGNGLLDRATSLAAFALENPDDQTADGQNVWDAIVERAAEENERFHPNVDIANVKAMERLKFEEARAADRGMVAPPTIQTMSKSTWAKPIQPVVTLNAQEQIPMAPPALNAATRKASAERKVFIVHGHDDAAKEAVARYLGGIGFEPIILHEQINRGGTIIEKFETHSAKAGFAVILLTPDDEGHAVNGGPAVKRARQNVILEWGYFIGALGRERVCALKKRDVELPSDAIGIVWEPFDDHGAWKTKLAKELAGVGYDIDWEKASA